MPPINILQEILVWSNGRPAWQRDALRRLISKGELDSNDIEELAQISRHTHGLANSSTCIPLTRNDIPPAQADSSEVRLLSITHNAGVNALAAGQTISFGEGLTVVYGANASGKSGYTRILKKLCRARGAEPILGNVVSGVRPVIPSASIRYRVDGTDERIEWNDNGSSSPTLSKVSVFDRHCASVYLTRQTNVAYRPFGLDVFDKLANACEDVRKILEKEKAQLAKQIFRFPTIPDGTVVHKLILSLTALTDVPRVVQLATLTDTDRARMEQLRKAVRDLESHDPKKSARTLELRATRGAVLFERLDAAKEILSGRLISAIVTGTDLIDVHKERARGLRQAAFANQPLATTGSSTWEALWTAARQFSFGEAYPDHVFPAVEDGTRCVLCQQELSAEARERFRRFERFFSSQMQREHDQAARNLKQSLSRVRDSAIMDEAAHAAIDELRLDNGDLAEAVHALLKAAEDLRQRVLKAPRFETPTPPPPVAESVHRDQLTRHFDEMRERATVLRRGDQEKVVRELRFEMAELEARQVLAENITLVLDEIERRKRVAVYQQCIDETKTTAVTRKSTEMTKMVVTDQLTRSFLTELNSLKFRDVEVRMVPARGSRGALLHKIELTRAPNMDVTDVVSEGEARCLSIASFFAELSTAEHSSTILFDDPVSSLDHTWRRNVAERLVRECVERQVIVFTHDIVFLVALREKAKLRGIPCQNQYLRRSGGNAGVADARVPWVAMNVSKRLGRLRELLQNAEKAHRKGVPEDYEREAGYLYGLLREAWERGAEEVLLAGTVERYRSSVQTTRARDLADITEQDCMDLHTGMTECSAWLTGHDQAAADNSPPPEPAQIQEDIELLRRWVERIRGRRT